MSNAEFPARTAGDLTLPNGDTVWICTLNTLLKDESLSESRWYAQAQSRCYLKGEERYAEMLAQVRGMSIEEQAQYLAGREYTAIGREAEEKYPQPQRPEQGDDTPEVFTKAVLKWEEDCKKIAKKRDDFEKKRYEEEVKKNTALTMPVRVDRCCTSYFSQKWGEAFTKRIVIETMYRAVRHSDDHDTYYFKSAKAFMSADDEVQTACTDFYYRVDPVRSDDIPTLPAAS